MLARREKRRSKRSDVRWPVSVESEHGTIQGEIRNISLSGIYVQCNEPLRVNEDFRMAIIPPNRQAIGLTGKVVWADMYGIDEEENAFGMGVCLVQIAEEDQEFLKSAVAPPRAQIKEQREVSNLTH
ncbi:MAG: PilZ domain-containing protein [Deltaproteobacteria bacterium]|nr:PilZ domain-containing protein [Deltaproteobacteria bacterium]